MDTRTAIMIILAVAIAVLSIPFNMLFLWIAGKITKAKIRFWRCFLPSLCIGALISLAFVLQSILVIPIVSALLAWIVQAAYVILYFVLPKLLFGLEWKKGILTGFLWVLFASIAGALFWMAIAVGSILFLVALGLSV